MENVKTLMCDLPNTIGGFTIASDGFFTIVLNKNLSHDRNVQTYIHEMKHIHNGDFDKKSSASLIEIMTHDI